MSGASSYELGRLSRRCRKDHRQAHRDRQWQREGRQERGAEFFFSSRRRHTRYWRDWSSDVCSSDLLPAPHRSHARGGTLQGGRRGGSLISRGSRAAPGSGSGGAASTWSSTRSDGSARGVGRAACRERGLILEVAGSLKKKQTLDEAL